MKTNLDLFLFDPVTNELIFQTTGLNTDEQIEGISFFNDGAESFIFDMAVAITSGPNQKGSNGSISEVTSTFNSTLIVQPSLGMRMHKGQFL